MTQYKFDDVAGLQNIVSEQWGEWSNEFTVTQDVIQQFADLTNDHNWIHLDVERCKKESPFGAPIAHGFLTLVLMAQMRIAPIDNFARLYLGGARQKAHNCQPQGAFSRSAFADQCQAFARVQVEADAAHRHSRNSRTTDHREKCAPRVRRTGPPPPPY